MKKYSYILFSLFCFSISVDAQNLLVADTNFAKAICVQYPGIMDYSCRKMDTAKCGSNYYQSVNLKYYSISEIREIVYFKNTKTIDASYNSIRQLPPLNKGIQWNNLLMSNNNLDEMPDLSPLRGSLQEIDFSNNKLTSVANLKQMTGLHQINLSNNKLRSLPDFSAYAHLDRINLSYNYLSFKDLNQFATFQNKDDFVNYNFSNQYPLTNDTTLSFYENSAIELKVPIDEGISGLQYVWYKDATVYAVTKSNVLPFSSIQKRDSGTYWVSVGSTNPKFKNVSVRSGLIKIKVNPCQEIKKFSFSVNSDCESNSVKLDALTLGRTYIPASIYLQNSVSGEKRAIQLNALFSVPIGIYHLLVEDDNNCVVKQTTALKIAQTTKCPKVFSPNGDGILDEFYLDGQGEARILDKDGILIKTIQLPNYWNGTDNSGNEAKIGTYLIVKQDGSSEKLTLLK